MEAVNQKALKKNREQFEDRGIKWCEVCNTLDKLGDRNAWSSCWRDNGLSFAHRHKRDWYKVNGLELLWDFDQVVLVCPYGHDKMEKDSDLTEQVFSTLRGEEIL